MPYPVPFQLLGDERKGWIDITYLAPDGSLRLSRGNKASEWRAAGLHQVHGALVGVRAWSRQLCNHGASALSHS